VLAGASDTLWRLRPWLFVVVEDEAHVAEACGVARDHGYQLWRFQSPLFDPDNYNRRTENIFPNGRAQGLLGVPEEVEIDVAIEGCKPVDRFTIS
jgi:hypothetical protein